MKELVGGLKEVNGYFFGAVECGIKYDHRLDFALIFSQKPCNASGLFTTNKISAAPVKLCKERINNSIYGILINATNANACTGEQGFNNAVALTKEVAAQMNVSQDSILMASTGVIGVQLPVDKMRDSIPLLIKSLSIDNARLIPRAIMTTDTIPKEITVSFTTSKGEYRIAGTAKGAGMIAPNMATLLSFILTDFPVEKNILKSIFANCIDKTLNSITIDGDMSTNDTAIILSPISDKFLTDQEDLQRFEDALMFILSKLSDMIIKDGEGTTKIIEIIVKGAINEDEPRKTAKVISESLLVKTAFFGCDPNWGRIACAAGYSDSQIDENELSILFEKIPVFVKGQVIEFDKKIIDDILSKNNISVTVDLGMGDAKAKYLTTDISYDYIKINSEYTT